MPSRAPSAAARGDATRMNQQAVVVNVGWVPGISAAQTLARAGVRVHAVDHREDALGFSSRHVHERHVSPRRLDDVDAWLAFLAALGDRLGAPAPLFALADDDLNTIAAARGRLGRRFLYPFPEWPVLERIQDKRHQIARARAAGIPTPRTSEAPTDELGFPVLVKPSSPDDFRRAFGVKAFRCDTLRARRSVGEGRAVPAARLGVDPGRRRHAVHARELRRARRSCARDVLRSQAAPGPRRDRQRARRGSDVGRRGRRAGARASPRARVPRRVAGRVQARSARRCLQADGGESAVVAVAQPGRSVRRQPCRDRAARPGRRAAGSGADAGRCAEALVDHVQGGPAPETATAAVRGSPTRRRRSAARGGAPQPARASTSSSTSTSTSSRRAAASAASSARTDVGPVAMT
jgi:hypothetical protein